MALMLLTNRRRRQRGMTLIEVLIAAVILIVGVLGVMGLVITAIASNGVNRQQSNSTVIAQMVMEKIMSAPANTSPTLSITDCAGNAHSITTTGSPSPGTGATLYTSGSYAGAVDFSSAAPNGYSMLYTTCGTQGRTIVYDVRWNIQTPSGNVKLITISAKQNSAGFGGEFSAFPVTIRSMAGLGS